MTPERQSDLTKPPDPKYCFWVLLTQIKGAENAWPVDQTLVMEWGRMQPSTDRRTTLLEREPRQSRSVLSLTPSPELLRIFSVLYWRSSRPSGTGYLKAKRRNEFKRQETNWGLGMLKIVTGTRHQVAKLKSGKQMCLSLGILELGSPELQGV